MPTADVEALLRSVTFRTLGDNPSPLTRTIQFQFRDASGLVSNTPVKQVVVQAVNDLPRVLIAGGQTFQAGQGPVVLAPDATLAAFPAALDWVATLTTGTLRLRASNAPGGSRPRLGCRQRNSASAPAIRPRRSSTMGW